METLAEKLAEVRVLAAHVLAVGRFYSDDQPRDEGGRWGSGGGGAQDRPTHSHPLTDAAFAKAFTPGPGPGGVAATHAEQLEKVAAIYDNRHAYSAARDIYDTSRTQVDPKGYWTQERSALHDRILYEFKRDNADVPEGRQLVTAGGLGGAGKTTILSAEADRLGVTVAGGQVTSHAVINADDFKERLFDHGAIPKVPGWTPAEASTFVHQEATYLADRASREMVHQDKNVVWDFTMAFQDSIRDRTTPYLKAGYDTKALFVDVKVDHAQAASERRHAEGFKAFVDSGGKSFGGRYVPKGNYDNARPPQGSPFQSSNRYAFQKWRESNPQVKTMIVDNNRYQAKIVQDSLASRVRGPVDALGDEAVVVGGGEVVHGAGLRVVRSVGLGPAGVGVDAAGLPGDGPELGDEFGVGAVVAGDDVGDGHPDRVAAKLAAVRDLAARVLADAERFHLRSVTGAGNVRRMSTAVAQVSQYWNEDQPRDEHGRWGQGGASVDSSQPSPHSGGFLHTEMTTAQATKAAEHADKIVKDLAKSGEPLTVENLHKAGAEAGLKSAQMMHVESVIGLQKQRYDDIHWAQKHWDTLSKGGVSRAQIGARTLARAVAESGLPLAGVHLDTAAKAALNDKAVVNARSYAVLNPDKIKAEFDAAMNGMKATGTIHAETYAKAIEGLSNTPPAGTPKSDESTGLPKTTGDGTPIGGYTKAASGAKDVGQILNENPGLSIGKAKELAGDPQKQIAWDAVKESASLGPSGKTWSEMSKEQQAALETHEPGVADHLKQTDPATGGKPDPGAPDPATAHIAEQASKALGTGSATWNDLSPKAQGALADHFPTIAIAAQKDAHDKAAAEGKSPGDPETAHIASNANNAIGSGAIGWNDLSAKEQAALADHYPAVAAAAAQNAGKASEATKNAAYEAVTSGKSWGQLTPAEQQHVETHFPTAVKGLKDKEPSAPKFETPHTAETAGLTWNKLGPAQKDVAKEIAASTVKELQDAGKPVTHANMMEIWKGKGFDTSAVSKGAGAYVALNPTMFGLHAENVKGAAANSLPTKEPSGNAVPGAMPKPDKWAEEQQKADAASYDSNHLGMPVIPGTKAAGSTGAMKTGEAPSGPGATALYNYHDGHYSTTNDNLRQGGNPTTSDQHLTELLDQHKVPYDTTVWRSVSSSAMGGVNQGKTFTDHGFISTDTTGKVAKHWSGDTLLAIRAPKGSSGLYKKNQHNETELLLQRGSTVRIISKMPMTVAGKEVWHAELVYQPAFSPGPFGSHYDMKTADYAATSMSTSSGF